MSNTASRDVIVSASRADVHTVLDIGIPLHGQRATRPHPKTSEAYRGVAVIKYRIARSALFNRV